MVDGTIRERWNHTEQNERREPLGRLIPDGLQLFVSLRENALPHRVHFILKLACVFGKRLGVGLVLDFLNLTFEHNFLFRPLGLVLLLHFGNGGNLLICQLNLGGTVGLEALEGVVQRVGTIPTYGTYVMISHGEYVTLYGNLSQVAVSQGQSVRAGEVIGRAGTASQRRGSQLFFALYQGGTAVNPASWLR